MKKIMRVMMILLVILLVLSVFIYGCSDNTKIKKGNGLQKIVTGAVAVIDIDELNDYQQQQRNNST